MSHNNRYNLITISIIGIFFFSCSPKPSDSAETESRKTVRELSKNVICKYSGTEYPRGTRIGGLYCLQSGRWGLENSSKSVEKNCGPGLLQVFIGEGQTSMPLGGVEVKVTYFDKKGGLTGKLTRAKTTPSGFVTFCNLKAGDVLIEMTPTDTSSGSVSNRPNGMQDFLTVNETVEIFDDKAILVLTNTTQEESGCKYNGTPYATGTKMGPYTCRKDTPQGKDIGRFTWQ